MANAGALLNKICANPGKNDLLKVFSKPEGLDPDAFSDRNYRDNIPFFNLFAADFFGVVELEVFSRVDWFSGSSHFSRFSRFFSVSFSISQGIFNLKRAVS